MDEPITSLQDWIKTATAGLPPSAVTKFRAEIADHAAEARQTYIAAGMPTDEADTAALAALGDAAEVARIFRNAHFSRREYTLGMISILALLATIVITLAFSFATSLIREEQQLNLVGAWQAVWQIVDILGSTLLLMLILRAGLVFLREQYDIHPPRWGWPVLAASVMIANGASLGLITANWDYTYGPLAISGEPGPMWWADLEPSVLTLSHFAMLIACVLAAAFCIGHLMLTAGRGQKALRPLLALGVMSALEVAVINAATLSPMLRPLYYYLWRAEVHLALLLSLSQYVTGIILEVAIMAPLLAMLLALLKSFTYMRHPDAVLAR